MKTFSELRTVYESTLDSNRGLKASTRKYYKESILYGLRAWPGLAEMDVAAITKFDCLEWSSRLNYSAPRFNGMISLFKAMGTLSVELELRKDNPFLAVKPMPVKIRPPKLPTAEQFNKLLECISWKPQCRRGLQMIKFLAFSGRRIGEVRKLTREDITEQGIRATDTKNGETIYGPILPEMRELLKELPESGLLFEIKNPRRCLIDACDRLKIPRLTNHTLRHLFATRAIECGVDIPTVARWLGHSDGGALALRRYNHVRNEHSKAMAETVRFGPDTTAQPEPKAPVSPKPATPKKEPVKMGTHRTLHAVKVEFEKTRQKERDFARLIQYRTVG